MLESTQSSVPKTGRGAHGLGDIEAGCSIIYLYDGSFWTVELILSHPVSQRNHCSESATECVPITNQRTAGIEWFQILCMLKMADQE